MAGITTRYAPDQTVRKIAFPMRSPPSASPNLLVSLGGILKTFFDFHRRGNRARA
jgi:hypothetical protein